MGACTVWLVLYGTLVIYQGNCQAKGAQTRVLSLSWKSHVWPTPLVMWLQEQQRSGSSTSYDEVCQHKCTDATEGSFGINGSSPAALTRG